MKTRKRLSALAAAVGMFFFIVDSKTALDGAAKGVMLCLKTIIPSLFPFLFLSGILLSAMDDGGFIPLKWVGKLFFLPRGTEGILIPAFLGGYPVGAQSVWARWQCGQINKRCAEKMLCFCSNAGPSFLFGIILTKFSRGDRVWVIWAIQIMSALTCARLFPAPACVSSKEMKHTGQRQSAMESAISAILKICGWAILFRMLLAFLDRWVFWAVPVAVRVTLIGLMELSNGCCVLSAISDETLRFIVCNVILSFGGLCVIYQTASVCTGLEIRDYVLGKCFQSLTALLLSVIIGFHLWALLAVWALIILLVPKNMQISSRKTQRIGV